MSSTSMSLETLQYLLQHMDANRRFEILNRCPSLRELEKTIPLKIHSLKFSEHAVSVNDTKYSIGIVRKCNVGKAHKLVELDNQRGGVQYEVDRYGIEDKSDATTVTLGDVELNKRAISRFGMPQGFELQFAELHISELKAKIQISEAQLLELKERRPNANCDELENILEADRAKLFAYQCRQTNIPPNYDNFLQLTTSTRAESFFERKTIERYHHNKKFREAVKQLNTVLFGGRSCPIHVKEMKFSNRHPHWVIRLPENVKFRVESLDFFGRVGQMFEALAPIIHESSYPLKQIQLSMPRIEDVYHPIVQSAGILKALMSLDYNLEVLFSITNPRVHVRSSIPPRTLGAIIRNWIEYKRTIGTEYIFDYGGEPWYMDDMEDVLKNFHGVPIDDKTVVFPMSEVIQLKISFEQFPEFAPNAMYAVKFLTRAIEQ
ncbi:unnamed protein product [Caenorhabditis brenneri]